MNCDILTKSGKFQFVKLDPSILNFNCRRLDIKEFFKKLKYCYENILIDPIIKEINETNYYEIIVFKPNRSFVYSNSNRDLILLDKDFCEKFNLRQIIKENIFNCKNEDEFKTSITKNIAIIDDAPTIISSSIGKKLLDEIIEALANIVNQDINDSKFYDYDELLKDCEIKFYNQGKIYRLTKRIIF